MIVYTVDYVSEDNNSTEELHTREWMADYRAFKLLCDYVTQPRWVPSEWWPFDHWHGSCWDSKVYEMKVQTP